MEKEQEREDEYTMTFESICPTDEIGRAHV